MSGENTQVKDRTDEELAKLAEAMEENEWPELGPAQGRLFDAVGAGLVYETPNGTWRDDSGKPAKAGLLPGRVEKKGLIELVRAAVAGTRPWSLTALGVEVDKVRNPERYAEDGTHAEPAEDAEGTGYTMVVDATRVLEANRVSVEDFERAGTTVTAEPAAEPVLVADSPLGASGWQLVDRVVGKTYGECEKELIQHPKAELFYLSRLVELSMPKSARTSDLVESILDTSFPMVDDGRTVEAGAPVVEAIQRCMAKDVAGYTRSGLAEVLGDYDSAKTIRGVAELAGVKVPTSANRVKVVKLILDAAFPAS
jgi:hypothetical protein